MTDAPHRRGIRSVRLAPGAAEILAQRAEALGKRGAHQAAHAQVELICFRLGPSLCAIPVERVAKVVRLGEVVPLPGPASALRGVAFVDNVPHLVLDLVERSLAVRRPLAQLAGAPALVLRSDDRCLAVCVEGPLDLSEADPALIDPHAASSADGLELSGRLPNGVLLISSSWFDAWAAGLAASG